MKLTHCALRLGDNLAALNFIRRCAVANPAEKFTHFALECYLPQLAPVVADLPNVKLFSLESVSNPQPTPWQRVPLNPESVDLWKNAGGYWARHPLRDDYAQFFVAHAHLLAARLGLESPIRSVRDLLFDYPALRPEKPPCEPFDFLIVNSAPQSGQLPAYDESQFGEVIAMLARRHHIMTTQPTGLKVTCTADFGLSVTEIGQLSQYCRCIIMVATGPGWPTFNIWNQDSVKLRVILSGSETINLSPHTVHTNKVYAVRDILHSAGFL